MYDISKQIKKLNSESDKLINEIKTSIENAQKNGYTEEEIQTAIGTLYLINW